MAGKEIGTLRRYETYSQLDHLTSVRNFLMLPKIEVLGVYISRHLESYRIIGLKIKDEEVGIIVKKGDLDSVRAYLEVNEAVDLSVSAIMERNLRIIDHEFTREEARVAKAKAKKPLRSR